MDNYTVLHLHSDLSNGVTNIDSITKYQQYIDYAQSLGMKAMAFSEHGSVFEWLKKKEAIEKAGMKYIHAEEFYVTESLDEKIRDNYHCILIAKNYDGVKELNKLSSISFNREDGHFYYVPRITFEELINTSDNIIITTACLGGILVHGTNSIRKRFIEFLAANKHRCYLEIQHHDVEDQIKYNEYLYKLSLKYDLKLVAMTDTHALNSEHLDGRAMLQKAKKIYFDNEEGWDLSFKNYYELVDAYERQNSLPRDVVLEAIENTNRIADSVEEFEMDRSYKYPHLWENPEKIFIQKIKDGLKFRGVDKFENRDEYAERIKYELKAYKHNGAIDFMLLMEDIVSWCRSQGIDIGYGRGSVNGSVIAWVLGITEMDSIKHNLNFDRFMNVERVSLSDIDTDFPPSRINEVKQYIFNHPGLHCSDIITFNTIADKGAIRDIGRALEMPLDEVSDICDAVDNESSYADMRDKYQQLFKYVDLVKGVIVSIGNHPCGMLVSPIELEDNIGLCTTSTDDCPISQLYMKEVDSLNYVKLDLLKLDTIELISETCKMAGIPMLLPDDLDINDVDVWNSMRDDTTGIFQWEGKTGDEYIKKLLSDTNINKFKEVNENVDRMTLLSIGNSAIRPAGASYRDDLARGIVRKSGSKAIDDFLKPTFGYLVFQCQIIEFLHKYCGFTMGEADVVRRHFAKKTGTETDIPIIKDGGYLNEGHYIPGFIATMKDMYGMKENEAEEAIVAFLQVIIDASNYLFSINHSEPYSYEGYACGYLRYYYPAEFLTCALNINTDNEEKTLAITNYAKKIGITLSGIKFGFSRAAYSCDPKSKTIYKGLSSIKFLNDTVSEELYSLSDEHFGSWRELYEAILNRTSCNSRQLDILIKLDYFSDYGEINQLLEYVDIFGELIGKKQLKKTSAASYPEWLLQKYCTKETDKQYRFDDINPLIDKLCETIEYPETTILNKIGYQREHLGYISLTVPHLSDDYVYITDIDGNWLTLYQLNNGDTYKIKCKSKDRKTNPISAGDIIKIVETYEDKKWKKDQFGDWYQIDEYETLIKSYKILK